MTGAVQRSTTHSNMAIAELQAKLQQSGESEWRKRHGKSNNASEEIRSLFNVSRCDNDNKWSAVMLKCILMTLKSVLFSCLSEEYNRSIIYEIVVVLNSILGKPVLDVFIKKVSCFAYKRLVYNLQVFVASTAKK